MPKGTAAVNLKSKYKCATFPQAELDVQYAVVVDDDEGVVHAQRVQEAATHVIKNYIDRFEEVLKDVDETIKKGADSKEVVKRKEPVVKAIQEHARDIIEKEVNQFIDKLTREDKGLKRESVKTAAKTAAKIGAAVVVAAASVATTVATAGGTLAVSVASIGAAVALITSTVKAALDATKDELDRRKDVKKTWIDVEANIEKQEKAAGADKGKLDKIKDFFKTNYAKKCLEELKAHSTSLVKVRKSIDAMSPSVNKVLNENERAVAELKRPDLDPKFRKELEDGLAKAEAAADKLLKGIVAANEELTKLEHWNAAMVRNVNEAQGKSPNCFGGKVVDVVSDLQETVTTLVEVGKSLKALFAAIK